VREPVWLAVGDLLGLWLTLRVCVCVRDRLWVSDGVPLPLRLSELLRVPLPLGVEVKLAVPLTLGDSELLVVEDALGDPDALGVSETLLLPDELRDPVPEGVGVGLRDWVDEGVRVPLRVDVCVAVAVTLRVAVGLRVPVPDAVMDWERVCVPLGVPLPVTEGVCEGVGLHTVFCANRPTAGQAPAASHDAPPLLLVQEPSGVPNPGVGMPPSDSYQFALLFPDV